MKQESIIPAIVRPADELAEYAARIALWVEAAAQVENDYKERSLAYYRQIGEELKEVQERISRGFRAWLSANVKFSRAQAYKYIKLANTPSTGDVEKDWEEWQRILGNDETESVSSTRHFDPPADPDSSAPDDVEADRGYKPRVVHNSGDEEWYTPVEFLEAARRVLGEFDLDPASCALANENVKAKAYCTKEQDGLKQPWFGRVWMNPPFSKTTEDNPGIAGFIQKLCSHFQVGDVIEAIVLTNNATDTGWFHEMAAQASCYCFPRGRLKNWYSDTDKGSSPMQGQVFTYLGAHRDIFEREFSKYGLILKK